MNAVGLPLPSPGELKQVHEDKSAAFRMWEYSSVETCTCRSLEGGGGVAAHMIGTQHANESVFSKLKLKLKHTEMNLRLSSHFVAGPSKNRSSPE